MAVDLTEKYPAAGKELFESPKRKRTVLWAVLLGGALLLLGLFIFFRVRTERAERAAADKAPVTGAATPVDVSATVAVSQSVTSFIQMTGSLAGVETSDVASLASGKVIATPINVGAFVAQGTIIARLDDRDARLKLQQTQAAEQQAAAALRQAQARLGLGAGGSFDATAVPEVRAARQSYESAEAQARLADANARRYENLVETGDVARSVFEQYRAQAETARAQANAARQQYEAAINTAR